MYPGQGSNGMQPIMSSNSQPIVSGGEAVILAPNEKKPKRWPIVVIAILVLIAIGTGIAAFLLTHSNEVVGDEVNSYIEYFVYGTEGGENQITNDTFAINSEDYAIAKKMQSVSAQESTDYYNKLFSKFATMESTGKKEINADLLKYNGIYLGYYKAITQSMNSDLLINAFNNGENFADLYKDLTVGDNEFLGLIYDTLNDYAKGRYGVYTKVKNMGCLANGEIDFNCIWDSGEEDNIIRNDTATSSSLEQLNEYIYEIMADNLSKFYEQGGRK